VSLAYAPFTRTHAMSVAPSSLLSWPPQLFTSGVAVLHDDEFLIAAGVFPLLPHRGYAWTFGSPRVPEHPAVAARAAKRIVERAIREGGYTRVETAISADVGMERWMEFLGFEFESASPRAGLYEQTLKTYVRFPRGAE
jgi:hypothetical protein